MAVEMVWVAAPDIAAAPVQEQDKVYDAACQETQETSNHVWVLFQCATCHSVASRYYRVNSAICMNSFR